MMRLVLTPKSTEGIKKHIKKIMPKIHPKIIKMENIAAQDRKRFSSNTHMY
jgi:hypothetical protein